MSLVNIKNAIKAKLQDMQTLKAVFEYESANPNGKYPFAVLTLRDGDGVMRTTHHNQRRQGFWIRVFQEQSKVGQGASQAESISVAVMDELQTAFDMDTTLSGICKYIDPLQFNADYVDRELDTRVLEVQLDAFEIVNSR